MNDQRKPEEREPESDTETEEPAADEGEPGVYQGGLPPEEVEAQVDVGDRRPVPAQGEPTGVPSAVPPTGASVTGVDTGVPGADASLMGADVGLPREDEDQTGAQSGEPRTDFQEYGSERGMAGPSARSRTVGLENAGEDLGEDALEPYTPGEEPGAEGSELEIEEMPGVEDLPEPSGPQVPGTAPAEAGVASGEPGADAALTEYERGDSDAAEGWPEEGGNIAGVGNEPDVEEEEETADLPVGEE